MDPFEDTGFVAPALERDGAADGFGASQYSFFGALGVVEESLDGALEDGLEAPPEEDLPDPDLLLEADEDLSYASMFASALKPPSPDEEEDFRTASNLRVQVPEVEAPPSKPKLGSIALGGLLTASTPSDAAFSAMPPSSTTSFASATSAFGSHTQSSHHQQQLPTPSPQSKAITPQELEAQLRGTSMQSPPPQPYFQQQQQQPLPPYPYGMPPPPGMAPPFMGSGGMMPPPGGAFPPLIPQPGVFTPDMIMQQSMQQQRPMMPYPPPPQQQQQQQSLPPLQQQQPLPPLGQGPPRPPHPSHQHQHHQQQQQRPSHPHANLAQRLRALNLADRPDVPRNVPLRRRYSSKLMSHDEIESILYMQWRPLHQGPPYTEDFYYQAFVYKYYGRRNKRNFAPESVRELAPTERVAEGDIAFVKLDGLGRVPFSNVRRPRPLMDVTTAGEKEEEEEEDGDDDDSHATAEKKKGSSNGVGGGRRLDQEPMLAARIMTEDCMALILDVQDIDRIFAAAGKSEIQNESALRQRRVLLMDGLAASLRLPETATAAGGTAADAGLSDAIFLRLLTLPKGKTLAVKALQTIYPPAEAADRAADVQPNLKILWAVLRNLRGLFGGGEDSSSSTLHLTSRVASATMDVLKGLHTPTAVCDALSAIIFGDLLIRKQGNSITKKKTDQEEEDLEAMLLPLFAPGEHAVDTRYPWLAQILASLIQRASEFDIPEKEIDGESDVLSAAKKNWKKLFVEFYDALAKHIGALEIAMKEAKAMGDGSAVEEIKGLVPVGLSRSVLSMCSKKQSEKLRSMLVTLGV